MQIRGGGLWVLNIYHNGGREHVKQHSFVGYCKFDASITCAGATPHSGGGYPSAVLCRGGAVTTRHPRVAQVVVWVPSASSSTQLTPQHSLDYRLSYIIITVQIS